MIASAVASEALSRATGSQSAMNYAAIIAGMIDKGIPEADIKPRENIFTFHAWQALGRVVRKGEHGIRITTWIPVPTRVDRATGEAKPGGMMPKSTSVFHVSQTDPLKVPR